MPKTRAAARPDHQQHLANAELRNRVKIGYEQAQIEEALKELLQLIGANGGKVPYGAVNKLIKSIILMVLEYKFITIINTIQIFFFTPVILKNLLGWDYE